MGPCKTIGAGLRARADGKSPRSSGPRRARKVAIAVALAAGLGAPVAHAAETRLDGSPIDVWTDGRARVQFRYDGVAEGVFFKPTLNAPSAGLEVTVNGGSFPLGTARPVSGPTLTTNPDGSRSLKSTYDFGDFLRVDEEVAYANGSRSADVTYSISDLTSGTLDVHAALLADLYVSQKDEGTGVLAGTAPNRFVGGRSAAGVETGISELTPWSSYQEGQFEGADDVFDVFERGDGLLNTINASYVDNMVAAEWDYPALAPDAPATIHARWLLGAPPGLLAGSLPGQAAPLPPPVAGKTVNLKLISGTVLYKPPGAKKFAKLTEDVQVPVGTTLDTLKGRVSINAASDLVGGTNKTWFYDGVFKVSQALAKKPITELALTGAKPACGASASAAAKKPKTRKLWGDGTGQFRTRGQFSSATVRGTKWVVIDRCDGTLTRVVRGVVAVRDFSKRKTIILRAGKQYLARRKSK